MAESCALPLFLHNRGTDGEFVEFLRDHKDLVRRRSGVVHSFDGSLEEANTLIDEFGLYIGINGCSLKTAENLDVVKQIPLSRLVRTKLL